MSLRKPTLATATPMVGGGHPTVRQRIETRLEVLQSWLRDGVPDGQRAPTSLKQVRVWKDLKLGISPISSPNEFTKTHHLHGPMVREIADLLTALRKGSGDRQATHPPMQPALVEVFDRRAFDRQLVAAVSQWHAERDHKLREQRRAAAAEARCELMLEEMAKKDGLIADLRSQLSRHKRLSAVK